MLYMSSQCTNDGTYSLTVTFELGTNLDMAQVLVQNRVSIAMPRLPEDVKNIGVTTKKKSPSILLVVNLFSPDGQYDQLYLSNYATIQIKDELARISGVGDVTFLGQQDYSMRVWLDPDQLASRNLTAGDAVRALREQNIQVAAGQIGQPPVPAGQDFQYTMSTLGRLKEPEQFADIIVKTGESGQVTRLRDIARIELGAKNQDQFATLDGNPSVGLAVFQLPGSNALEVAEQVRGRMDELSGRFPDGLQHAIVYDTTPFIKESIHEVFNALRDAVILVAIVVLVFLQSWRSTLIPLIAVPVSIVGTFFVMALMGFSLNNISLFGLVLAIGVVVDDAIVVVEAMEHHMDHGLSPKEAAYKAMEQVTGPVIATSLVLMAVFVPAAFVPGLTGQFFRQFALTIAVATAFSTVNSLTLSPALGAVLLRPKGGKRDIVTVLLDGLLGWFFKLFNRGFETSTRLYVGAVRRMVRLSAIVLFVYAGLGYATYWSFGQVPTGFIPEQDKGYLLVNAQLPDSASLERSIEVLEQIDAIALEEKGVAHTVGIAGQSFLLNANGSNFVSTFVILDDFEERHDPAMSAAAITARLRRVFSERIPDAVVMVFGAPPVEGLGTSGGFKLMIQDRGNVGFAMLEGQVGEFAARGRTTPGLAGMFSMFRANTPQLFAEIDRTKCKTLGLPLTEVFDALQTFLGSAYVNDFNRFGRTWQVKLQADSAFRVRPEDVAQLKVRNQTGDMIPLGTVVEVRDSAGPIFVERYNMYASASVNGATSPGVSSGDGVAIVESLADQQLPDALSYEWTDLTFLQQKAGSAALLAFAGGIILVFLILAAQYESWSLPFSVILIMPMCLLSSLIGIAVAGMDVNIFTQIGFIVLAGLASKNAILIVEFAKQQQEADMPVLEATVEACRLRLRPIMMTAFTFILGVLPLVIATGAGAEMRVTLGTAVFSGMLGVTLFGVFLTPVFYFVIQSVVSRFSSERSDAGSAPTAPAPELAASAGQGI